MSRQAASHTPNGSSKRLGRLSNLGSNVREKFLLKHAVEDFDDARAALEELLAETPEGHPSRARWLYNLSILLNARFFAYGR